MPAKKRSAAKRATAKRTPAKRSTEKRASARRVTTDTKTMSAKEAAIEYLRKHRGEQPVKDVINAVLNDPRVTGLKGKTPEATIAAQIYTEAKKPDGRIAKVGRGTVEYSGE